MKTLIINILFAITAFFIFTNHANAFDNQGAAIESQRIAFVQTTIQANNNYDTANVIMPDSYSSILAMVTGSPTGTYFRFGHDIKEVIRKDNIDIEVKTSRGSITNIQRIGSNENAAFGIVQSDVLGFLGRSHKPASRKLAENLRMIFPFYKEEVHIIANKRIKNFNDLDKKTVAVGLAGSGSWLTAMNMFNITKIRPEKLRRLTPEEGMKAVLTGDVDAMIFVAGKPVTLFETLGELSENAKYSQIVKNVHFVPITNKRLYEEYSQSTLTAEEYSIITNDVPTIAVTAALVSYDFSNADSNYARSRCNDIKRFSIALNNQLDELKAKGHPKWKEVDLDAEIGLWKKDKCSALASTSAELESELLDGLQMSW